jgi:hypothetical protein
MMLYSENRSPFPAPVRGGPSAVPIAKGTKKISYAGYQLTPEIIRQAIWLFFRFTLNLRDVEEVLAERAVGGGTIVSRIRISRPWPTPKASSVSPRHTPSHD